jgi:gamma-glutamyltranspeptidase/glutathione hydrolase
VTIRLPRPAHSGPQVPCADCDSKTTGGRSFRPWHAKGRDGVAKTLALILIVFLTTSACRADGPRRTNRVAGDLVRCRDAVVVSVSPPATAIGVDVLARGGTAVDAAIATGFALSVTWPLAGNVGGGGYMLIVPSDHKTPPTVVDFREIAPADAKKDMFVQPEKRTAHRRIGVPGTVAGFALAHQRFGKLPWRELVTPAVELAKNGFLLDAATAESLNSILKKTNREKFAEFHRVYARPTGGRWQTGDRLTQPDLAATLERIAERGPAGFYTGETADRIVAEMHRGGGLITLADLAAYRAKFREPVRGTYRGCEIISVPPSSSGGTTLVEMLNILENFELRSHGRWSPETLHLMIEAMKRAYRDRACYLGDPDVVSIPAQLTQKDYARQLASTIDPRRATPSAQLAGEIRIAAEAEHTTHFSIIDRARMAVSLTYTLEDEYGSRVVVPGGGFILNDEMNDFAWLPGVTNVAGRIGTPPNQIAPGKRMLSSMCPTIVRRDGKPLLITGSPGGRTIINTVLQMVVNVVDFRMDLRTAVDEPRLHHQWLPDLVKIEPSLARTHAEAVAGLRRMGHQVKEQHEDQGDAHSILIDPVTGELIGAADKREDGRAGGF